MSLDNWSNGMKRKTAQFGNIKLHASWGWKNTWIAVILGIVWYNSSLGIAALALLSHVELTMRTR